ncbi:MAG: DUF4177 domain-containing protein [Pseudomonadota bacterium]
MSEYEYRVIAAPTKGQKAKGIKSAEDRYSHALELKMNEMAAEGWEYQRAEALPSVERSGLTSTKTTWHNLLVFRRLKIAAPKEIPLTAPIPALSVQGGNPTPEPRADPPIVSPVSPEDDASQSEGASRMLRDNGVEELSEVSGMTDSLKQLAKNRNPENSDD